MASRRQTPRSRHRLAEVHLAAVVLHPHGGRSCRRPAPWGRDASPSWAHLKGPLGASPCRDSPQTTGRKTLARGAHGPVPKPNMLPARNQQIIAITSISLEPATTRMNFMDCRRRPKSRAVRYSSHAERVVVSVVKGIVNPEIPSLNMRCPTHASQVKKSCVHQHERPILWHPELSKGRPETAPRLAQATLDLSTVL